MAQRANPFHRAMPFWRRPGDRRIWCRKDCERPKTLIESRTLKNRFRICSSLMSNVQPISLHRPTRSAPIACEQAHAAIPGHRVELQLLTTLKCNLKCTYCSLGVGEVLGSQKHVDYSLEQLAQFIDSQLAGYETYVTFYGGEPTLNTQYMQEVIARFPN